MTISSTFFAEKTAFINAGTNGNQLNIPVFKQEVLALALSALPLNVYPSGTGVRADWPDDNITAADEVLLDQAVIDHIGGVTSGSFQVEQNNAAQTRPDNATNNNYDDETDPDPQNHFPHPDSIAVELDSGLLVGGTYRVTASAELRGSLSGYATEQGVQGIVEIDDDDGNGFQNRAQTEVFASNWQIFPFVGETFNVKDGERIQARIRYKRVGAGPNIPQLRRARIFLSRED